MCVFALKKETGKERKKRQSEAFTVGFTSFGRMATDLDRDYAGLSSDTHTQTGTHTHSERTRLRVNENNLLNDSHKSTQVATDVLYTEIKYKIPTQCTHIISSICTQ